MGLGLVDIMGSRDYSMRVWLKPDKLLAYNISTDEIIAGLRAPEYRSGARFNR